MAVGMGITYMMDNVSHQQNRTSGRTPIHSALQFTSNCLQSPPLTQSHEIAILERLLLVGILGHFDMEINALHLQVVRLCRSLIC